MLSHEHLFYGILALGGILVVLYTTGNLSNTSNVVILLLFAITILSIAVAFDTPKVVPVTPSRGGFSEAITVA
jgi:hypothetical protein